MCRSRAGMWIRTRSRCGDGAALRSKHDGRTHYRGAGKRSGQPCIRGMRITVWDVLGWLAAGQSEADILADYPELEREDFRAVYDYAAKLGRRVAQ